MWGCNMYLNNQNSKYLVLRKFSDTKGLHNFVLYSKFFYLLHSYNICKFTRVPYNHNNLSAEQ